MKRTFLAMFGLAMLPWAAAFPLFAQTIATIHESPDSDPLTIYVANDLSLQIKDGDDGQVNPPSQQLADSGFFASFGGTVYGPDFSSHPDTSVFETLRPTPWTPLYQDSDPQGFGNSGDPWTVTTRVQSSGSEVQVERIVSYVNNEEETDVLWKIKNISGTELNCRFTHAAAMYMQGDGSAFGFYDPATGSVGGKNQAGNWYEELIPQSLSQPTAYEVNDYDTIWTRITTDDPQGTEGPGLADIVSPDYIPVAAALQWDLTLPAGGEADIELLWKMGNNPPFIPTPTPIPPPIPPATPGIVMTLNSVELTAGDRFTVDVTVQPVNQPFDAWAVIIGNGAAYSMVLSNPAMLRGGLHPLVSGIKRLASPLSRQLLNLQIPPGVTGSYNVIVGLVPAGDSPSARNAIPNYLAQAGITIH